MKVEKCIVMINDYVSEKASLGTADVIEQDGKRFFVVIWDEMSDGSRRPSKLIPVEPRYLQPAPAGYDADWFYRKPILDPKAHSTTQ